MAEKKTGLTPAQTKRLLEKNPKKLSDEDKTALLRLADQLYGNDGKQWMKIGRCVSRVVLATPGLSREEREEQLNKEFDRLPYQTGKKAMRVYEKYQDSPAEVVSYGLDLADRIRDKPKSEREALLKKHGTPRKVREALIGKAKAENVGDHKIELGGQKNLVGAFRSQSEEVVLACSDWAKRIRSVILANKPLKDDFEHEFEDQDDLISAGPIILTVEGGCVVIELCCTEAEAKARAATISACLGFESLQRFIDKEIRLI